jgi:DNA-binding transcriptional regulator YiaG
MVGTLTKIEEVGLLTKSIEVYREMKRLCAYLGLSTDVGLLDAHMAGVYKELGRDQDALELFESARTAFSSIGREVELAVIDRSLASLQLKSNNPRLALNYLTEARQIYESKGMKLEIASTLLEIADCHTQTQDYDEQFGALEAADDILQGLKKRGLKAELADLWNELTERRRARKNLERAQREPEDDLRPRMIRDWRTANELSRTQVSKMLGVDVATLRRWEEGTVEPSALNRAKILSLIRNGGGEKIQSEKWSSFKRLPSHITDHVGTLNRLEPRDFLRGGGPESKDFLNYLTFWFEDNLVSGREDRPRGELNDLDRATALLACLAGYLLSKLKYSLDERQRTELSQLAKFPFYDLVIARNSKMELSMHGQDCDPWNKVFLESFYKGYGVGMEEQVDSLMREIGALKKYVELVTADAMKETERNVQDTETE